MKDKSGSTTYNNNRTLNSRTLLDLNEKINHLLNQSEGLDDIALDALKAAQIYYKNPIKPMSRIRLCDAYYRYELSEHRDAEVDTLFSALLREKPLTPLMIQLSQMIAARAKAGANDNVIHLLKVLREYIFNLSDENAVCLAFSQQQEESLDADIYALTDKVIGKRPFSLKGKIHYQLAKTQLGKKDYLNNRLKNILRGFMLYEQGELQPSDFQNRLMQEEKWIDSEPDIHALLAEVLNKQPLAQSLKPILSRLNSLKESPSSPTNEYLIEFLQQLLGYFDGQVQGRKLYQAQRSLKKQWQYVSQADKALIDKALTEKPITLEEMAHAYASMFAHDSEPLVTQYLEAISQYLSKSDAIEVTILRFKDYDSDKANLPIKLVHFIDKVFKERPIPKLKARVQSALDEAQAQCQGKDNNKQVIAKVSVDYLTLLKNHLENKARARHTLADALFKNEHDVLPDKVKALIKEVIEVKPISDMDHFER